MSRWAPLVLALAALVLGAGWAHAWKGRIRADALAEQSQAHVDALHDTVGFKVDSLAASDLRAASQQKRYDSLRTVAEASRTAAVRAEGRAGAALAVARAGLDAALDSLGPVADSVRAQLATERQAHESLAESLRFQVGALTVQLALSDSSVAALGSRLTARDALIASLQATLAEQTALSETYRREAYPSLFAGLWKDLPKYAAVAAGLHLAWEVVR